jgi:hypothetical protein
MGVPVQVGRHLRRRVTVGGASQDQREDFPLITHAGILDVTRVFTTSARRWPFLGDRSQDGGPAVEHSRSGDSLDTASHPAAWPAVAASAAAAGDDNASDYHLDAADALARVWLDTDLLGGCRPGQPRTT